MHLIPVLPVALLLFAGLGLTAYFLLSGPLRERETRYRIGVVGDMDDPYMSLGFQAIRTFDRSRDMAELIPMTEEEAAREFASGNILAYVMIPGDFADSVVHGRNDIPVRYVFWTGNKGIEGYLMDELAVVVSDIVGSSQAAVFSVQQITAAYSAGSREDLTGEYNMDLIRYLVTRTHLARLEELGVSKGLLVRQYYFCTTLLLFCFMFGIGGSSFFFRRNTDMSRWMMTKGIGPFAQVMCEYCAYLIMMTVCLFTALGVLSALTDGLSFLHKDIWMAGLFLSLIPAVMMIGALHFAICELVRNPAANIILQFTGTLAMGYISGFIYPADSFPESISGIGQILPTGAALDHLSNSVFGTANGRPLLLLIFYTAIFISVSVLARNLEIRRDKSI